MVNWMDGLKKIQEGGASNKDKERTGKVNKGLGDEAPDNSKRLPINFPYRGQEQHGVAAIIPPYVKSPDEWDYYSPPEVDPIHIPDPIRVIVVDETARELKEFRTYQATVNNQPTMIASRQTRRNKLVLKNTSKSGTVYIGAGVNVSYYDAYPMSPGETLVMDHVEREVWAILGPQLPITPTFAPNTQIAMVSVAAAAAGSATLPPGYWMSGFDITFASPAAAFTAVATVYDAIGGVIPTYNIPVPVGGTVFSKRYINPIQVYDPSASMIVQVAAIVGGSAYTINMEGLLPTTPIADTNVLIAVYQEHVVAEPNG